MIIITIKIEQVGDKLSCELKSEGYQHAPPCEVREAENYWRAITKMMREEDALLLERHDSPISEAEKTALFGLMDELQKRKSAPPQPPTDSQAG